MSATDDNTGGLGGDDAIAAEYVLGVLDGEARLTTARRIETDAAFARLVDQWEVTLAPIGREFKEIEPPASIKQAIDERLFASLSQEAKTSGIWANLAFWRGLALAGAIATAVAIAVPTMAPKPPSTEPMVAALMPQQSDVQYTVMYDGSSDHIGLSHLTGDRSAGHDFELWLIEGDKPPRSLGVIPAGQSVRISVNPDMRRIINSSVVLAISVEPSGGSTTGSPTGPVVAAGEMRSI